MLRSDVNCLAVGAVVGPIVRSFGTICPGIGSLPCLVVSMHEGNKKGDVGKMGVYGCFVHRTRPRYIDGDCVVRPRTSTCGNGVCLLASACALSTTRDFALSVGRDKGIALVNRTAKKSANGNPHPFYAGRQACFHVPAHRPSISSGNFPVRNVNVPPRRRMSRAMTSFVGSRSAILGCTIKLVARGRWCVSSTGGDRMSGIYRLAVLNSFTLGMFLR